MGVKLKYTITKTKLDRLNAKYPNETFTKKEIESLSILNEVQGEYKPLILKGVDIKPFIDVEIINISS